MPLLSARPLAAVPIHDAEPCWRRPDPRLFARDLADLGPLFCAWSQTRPGPSARAATIAEGGPDGRVLATPGCIAHACAVTSEGPREWITVHDLAGVPRCRLYLLPDTDYLAWDALLSHAVATAPPEPPRPWRARCGRRLRFEVDAVGPWSLVCARTAAPDCALSWRTVRELVRTEGVALVT
ncbi:MAG TPA: hypothetical protein VFR91_04775 [Dyella sp.]|nr:hypothetical protein [Dyella sp.]